MFAPFIISTCLSIASGPVTCETYGVTELHKDTLYRATQASCVKNAEKSLTQVLYETAAERGVVIDVVSVHVTCRRVPGMV